MTETKETLILAKEILTELLENELGIYEYIQNGVVLAEAPAIAIRYPLLENQTPKRVKKDSGIECIIDSQVDTNLGFMQKGHLSIKWIAIILDQHDPTLSCYAAMQKILCSVHFDIVSQPIIRKAQALDNGGVLPARTILYHRQAEYLEKVF